MYTGLEAAHRDCHVKAMVGRCRVNSSSVGLIYTAQGYFTQRGPNNAWIMFVLVCRKGAAQGQFYCAQG